MQPLSTVIITFNEAHNLSRTLAKLTWCDEIIIVDSGSTDNSLEICASFGCKIFHRDFDGYGPQKRYAVSLARNKWILCLDADEVLSDALVVELQELMKNPQSAGYLIPLTLVFLGKEFKYGSEAWKYFLRLFNRDFGNFDESLVHEKVLLTGNKQKLKNHILHYSYRDTTHYFSKSNEYSSYGAEIAYQRGKRRSVAMIVIAVPLNFLKTYFVDLNFLNGLNGFYWSLMYAFHRFAKYVKIKELFDQQRVGNDNPSGPRTLSQIDETIKGPVA